LIWALFFAGRHDRGARVLERVRVELANHGHAPTVALCKLFAEVWPELLFGDLEICERRSEELVAHCVKTNVEHFRRIGAVYIACSRVKREPTPRNFAAFHSEIKAKGRFGSRSSESLLYAQVAEVMSASGHFMEAEAALQEGVDFVEQSGERYWLAELHRIEGQIAIKRPERDWARAKVCFLKAIEIAHGQAARLLELRAATDLARLWRDTGSPNDLRELLEPILAAIEGGETTRDVRAARALLAEIV
jgi:hypothetical protein